MVWKVARILSGSYRTCTDPKLPPNFCRQKILNVGSHIITCCSILNPTHHEHTQQTECLQKPLHNSIPGELCGSEANIVLSTCHIFEAWQKCDAFRASCVLDPLLYVYYCCKNVLCSGRGEMVVWENIIHTWAKFGNLYSLYSSSKSTCIGDERGSHKACESTCCGSLPKGATIRELLSYCNRPT